MIINACSDCHCPLEVESLIIIKLLESPIKEDPAPELLDMAPVSIWGQVVGTLTCSPRTTLSQLAIGANLSPLVSTHDCSNPSANSHFLVVQRLTDRYVDNTCLW